MIGSTWLFVKRLPSSTCIPTRKPLSTSGSVAGSCCRSRTVRWRPRARSGVERLRRGMIPETMKTLQNKTFYELLDVAPDASPYEIRHAYEEMHELYSNESLGSYSFFTETERRTILSELEHAYLVLIDSPLPALQVHRGRIGTKRRPPFLSIFSRGIIPLCRPRFIRIRPPGKTLPCGPSSTEIPSREKISKPSGGKKASRWSIFHFRAR